MMKRNVKRKSNKGFTLTEVIIAVAILAIAATPLISNFVKSGTINKKARAHLNAMNIAQDIMEGFSAYKGEDLINKFESQKSLRGNVLPSGMEYASHGDMSFDGTKYTRSFKVNVNNKNEAAIASGSGARLYSEKSVSENSVKVKMNKDNPNYYFYIDGLKQQKTTYNVDVTISYDKYKKTVGPDLNRMYDVNGKVDCSYSNIEAFSGDKALSSSPYQTVLTEQFIGKSSSSPKKEDFDGKVYHTIKCVVKNDTSDPKVPNYQVLITDRYEVKSAYRSSLGLTDTNAVKNIRTEENIYPNSAIEKPRNVYIYYTGMVGSSASNVLDTIEIENLTGEPINFYVLRQKRRESDPINESYKCSLNIVSRDSSKETDKTNYHTKVVQNLRYNLNYDAFNNLRYYDESGKKVSNWQHLDAIQGKVSTTDSPAGTTYYDRTRCDIKYNLPTLIEEKVYDKCISDGIMKDTTPAVYDVTIVVKDAKNNKKVAEYTGSLSGGIE
ncbi:MAG: prepilin-type N-terminal cleavage/methylation domain-containing protein [Lachnospiraceae bacterium]|nr:prepilin-type N-terminal cleavage/methylation domain-containing protein [Lachnospiraceae bacterium]